MWDWLGVGLSIKRCQNSNYKYVQTIKGQYTNNDSTNKKYQGRNGKHKKEPIGNSSVESLLVYCPLIVWTYL